MNMCVFLFLFLIFVTVLGPPAHLFIISRQDILVSAEILMQEVLSFSDLLIFMLAISILLVEMFVFDCIGF